MELYFVALTGRTEDNYFKFEFCDDYNNIYVVFISEEDFESYLDLEGINWGHVYKNEPSLLTDVVQDLVDRSQLNHTMYGLYINKIKQ